MLVIGLDGATFDLIEPWCKRGHLPNIRGLMENGSYSMLRSTTPPKTAPAWLTMITGMNPGRHGIFDFFNFDISSYTGYKNKLAVGPNVCAGKTTWDQVSKAGGKVGVVRVPMTYPVWEVNGIMIADGVYQKGQKEKFAYPDLITEEFLAKYLERKDFYRLLKKDLHDYLNESLNLIKRRIPLAVELFKKEDYDFFMVVFDAPDRSQHHFWKYMEDSSAPSRFQEAILEHYKLCDKAIGQIMHEADEDTCVLIVSDHGAGPSATMTLNLNTCLAEWGFLKFKSGHNISSSLTGFIKRHAFSYIRDHFTAKDIQRLKAILPKPVSKQARKIARNVSQIEWDKTKAYGFPMTPPTAGIVINLKNRQPKGIVELNEYESLRDLIIDKLHGLRDRHTGQKIIREIYKREQIYSGENIKNAPDIVVEMDPNYCGNNEMSNKLVSKTSHDEITSGQHMMDGIFIGAGKDIKNTGKLDKSKIEDVAPTILYLLGIPIPNYCDGRIIKELISEKFLKHNTAKHLEKGKDVKPTERELSDDDEQALTERLKGLGYLD